MSFALTLPDGSKKEFDVAVSVADLASSISTSLAKNAVAGKVEHLFKGIFGFARRPLVADVFYRS